MDTPPAADAAHEVVRKERGIVLVLTAIFLSILVLLVVFAISLTEWSHATSNYHAAANGAAVSAAATLCSTRDCYNRTLLNALTVLDSSGIRGQHDTATFKAQLNAAITDLQTQIGNNVHYITGPDGKTNEWNIDGVRVRVQRGRWWPAGVYVQQLDASGNPIIDPVTKKPTMKRTINNCTSDADLIPPGPMFTGLSTVTVEPKFEAFDRFDGTSWQTCNANVGTPNFLAANAVRVTLETTGAPNVFLISHLPVADLTGDSISARNKSDPQTHTFCAAPFAVPACSLLDDTGEYQTDTACQYDRYFTDVKRYCSDASLADGSCKVLPGMPYGTATPVTCNNSGQPGWTNQECQCAMAAKTELSCGDWDGPPEWLQGDHVQLQFANYYAQPPCTQQLGQGAMACNFNSQPKLDETADHYGVVGASMNAVKQFPYIGLNLANDSAYQSIFGKANGCTEDVFNGGGASQLNWYDAALPTKIGDPFQIKTTGLTDPAIDQTLWQRIYGKSHGNQAARQYPKFFDPGNSEFGDSGFRELGYPWFIGRSDDVNGYPFGETKNLLDQLITNQWIQPYAHYGELDTSGKPKQAIAPYECIKAGLPDYGVCNSHRTWYNNRCARAKSVASGGFPAGISRYTDARTPVHQLDYVENFVQNSNTCAGSQFEHQDPNTGNFTCADVPPYMPCNIPNVGGVPEGGESAPSSFWSRLSDYPAADIPVWHTNVAIIADNSANAQPCRGEQGSAAVRDPVIDPSHDWRVIGFVRAYFMDDDIGKPPPAAPGASYPSEPGVCEYNTNARQPWKFNPTYVGPPATNPTTAPQNLGAPANCNMVRAHLTCTPGLVAGDYRGLATEPKPAPQIVFSK